jgi:polyisoprenoid-binding protein YceI
MKTRSVILIAAFALVANFASAQKKVTTSASVSFDATTEKDRLPKAENKTVVAAVDTKTGSVQFEAAVKNFSFSNPTIQEHFNQKNWMDSDAFPAFTFKGNITNLSAINFLKDGTYTANVEGVLSVKGKEKALTVPATVVVSGTTISATSEFAIKLDDFGISGAPIESGKVSKEPKVLVRADFN